MNIYVGNLSWDLTEQDLLEMFAPYGEVVSAKIVTDKFNNNRSKGFGFVEMPNPREAIKAVKGLNTLKLKGLGIRVKIAEDKA